MDIRESQKEKFWQYVDKSGDCWIWTGAKTGRDYGMFVIDWYQNEEGAWRTVTRGAHRVAYELEVGLIPEGLTLDHLCGVHDCVNPEHLEPVTLGENSRRGNTRQGGLCKAGLHLMAGENLIVRPSRPGRTECRECAREGNRRRYKMRSI